MFWVAFPVGCIGHCPPATDSAGAQREAGGARSSSFFILLSLSFFERRIHLPRICLAPAVSSPLLPFAINHAQSQETESRGHPVRGKWAAICRGAGHDRPQYVQEVRLKN